MLYELIKGIRTLSVIGMCKNAGKTTVLNTIKEEIICNDANEWVEVFFRYYMQGSSVSYSCQKASEQASSIGNHYYIAH